MRDRYGVPAVTGSQRLRRLVGRRLRGGPGPAVPARAVPPRHQRPAGRDPGRLVPGRRPDRPPRLLHRRRDRPDDRAHPAQRCCRRAEAYRDGINAWSAKARSDPVADCRASSPPWAPRRPTWTLRDTARIGIFLARTVPSGDGARAGERPRPARARRRGVRQAAAAAHPRPGDHRAQARTALFPSQPGRTPRQERGGLPPLPHVRGAPGAPAARGHGRGLLDRSRQPRQPAVIPHGGSYMWAIGRPAKKVRRCTRRGQAKRRCRTIYRRPKGAGNAYLFNGPQLGFSIPELFVEFELHSPEPEHARGQRRRRAGARHRAQRPRRLGLHVGALRRGRPVRREHQRRPGELPLQGLGAQDGLPRRALRLPRARPPTCPT